jgi:hypothetical protein
MWWNGGTDPCILNFSTRWRWEVSFMLWPHSTHGETGPVTHRISWVEPRASLDTLEKRKICCPWKKLKPWFLGCPTHSLVIIQSSLYMAIWSNLTDSKFFTACNLLIMIYITNLIYFIRMLIIHLYRKLNISSFNGPLVNTAKVKAKWKFLTASSFVFHSNKVTTDILRY